MYLFKYPNNACPFSLKLNFFHVFLPRIARMRNVWSKILADNPSLISLKLTLQNLTKKISWKFGI